MLRRWLRRLLPDRPAPDPAWWGLTRRDGHLWFAGRDLVALAAQHGTPLHVADAARLRANAQRLVRAFSGYPGGASVHFSYKTNAVGGVLSVLHAAGLGAEVVDGYELALARELRVDPERIVFNGPNKRDAELVEALELGVGLIVVDHADELDRVAGLAASRGTIANVGLRICPDVVPARMNASSLTGSRKNQFGLDLPSGEAAAVLARACAAPSVRLRGVMAHIGSGIHDLGAWRRTVDRLLDLHARARALGAHPDLLDVGGGLGTRLSREFTTAEQLAYLGFGRLPALGPPAPEDLVDRYAAVVTEAVLGGCRARGLPPPRLVLEPGRVVTSDAQVLLLRVGHVRDRPGVGAFAIADGGALTVSMMFLSEVHAVFLADRDGGPARPVNVFGALPSPMDVVYRNLPLPPLRPGDVLVVADAGAYFTATATNFGGPRPGVLLVDGAEERWARRPETVEDLLRLDRP